MLNNSTQYFFNFDALLFGGVMLFIVLALHAAYMFLISHQYEKITDALIAAKRYGWARALFYVMAFILALSHLLEIYIWGLALNLFGLIPNVHQAMLFAGSAYTTLGFDVNPLPLNWDLVMIMMALSGIISFGWSISVLFGMTQIIHIARIQRKA